MDTDPNICSVIVKKTSPSSSSSSSEAGSDPIVGSRDLGPTWVKNGALPCESGNPDEPCENTYPGVLKGYLRIPFFLPQPLSLTHVFSGPR